MTEDTTPKQAQQVWRDQLATKHLATFLALRAQELKPGAEAILMMVGSPNMFITPSLPSITTTTTSPSSPSPSALTLAMKACIQKGTLREEVLERTFIPYYNRTMDDIKAALQMAANIPIRKHKQKNGDTSCSSSFGEEEEEMEYPGSFLRLVDLVSYPVLIGGTGDTRREGTTTTFSPENNNDNDDNDSNDRYHCNIQGSFEMFWSIHQGSIQGTGGATKDELEAIRMETMEFFHKLYDPQKGIVITFVACVVRRQTRKAWGR